MQPNQTPQPQQQNYAGPPAPAGPTPQQPLQPVGTVPMQPPINGAPQPPVQQPNQKKGGLFGFGGKPPNTNPTSTQNILKIAEIRDGLVIMNDGTYRAVIYAKSINFDLMSSAEKEAVEINYQGFINNLYFPIQIFIRSKRVDISKYLDSLQKQKGELDNILLSMMMDDYIQFIATITEHTNIMDKQFYIVIPYNGVADLAAAKEKGRNLFSSVTSVFAKNNAGKKLTVNEEDLIQAKIELKNRTQSVLGGLSNLGVQGVALNTHELIDLYYHFYNHETADNQAMSPQSAINAPIIRGAGS